MLLLLSSCSSIFFYLSTEWTSRDTPNINMLCMVIHIVEDAVKKLPSKGDRPALRLKTKPLSLSIASFVLPTTSALCINQEEPVLSTENQSCGQWSLYAKSSQMCFQSHFACEQITPKYAITIEHSFFVISYQESNQHKLLFTPKFLLMCVDFQILYSFSYYHHPV